MRKYILYTFCLMSVISVSGQDMISKPCSAVEANQFDFWIGDWNLTYNDTVHASNRITKEMDGCVIFEHFDDPSQSFKGWSWSMYNQKSKVWQQTWVDNQGGYIVLTGTYENDKMILSTEPKKQTDRQTVQNRMIFYNITPGSFDWNWETTKDEGKSWKVTWKIHYERKK